ncbi:hypothetical protein PENSPDRAFT_253975 [Peniophora sp. CONT]|nr:hypothetical protein PENSPDRAFT_253975 [Peniophora sp. CONT]
MFLRERATASPSVAIEKGGYRIHGRSAPLEQIRLRGRTKLRTESRPSVTAQKSLKYDRRISILLLFCALAAVSCFSTAYWLFITGSRGCAAAVILYCIYVHPRTALHALFHLRLCNAVPYIATITFLSHTHVYLSAFQSLFRAG